jgi:hypothetical protein
LDEDNELEDDLDAWAFGKLMQAKSRRYSTDRKFRKYSGMDLFSEDLLQQQHQQEHQQEEGGG